MCIAFEEPWETYCIQYSNMSSSFKYITFGGFWRSGPRRIRETLQYHPFLMTIDHWSVSSLSQFGVQWAWHTFGDLRFRQQSVPKRCENYPRPWIKGWKAERNPEICWDILNISELLLIPLYITMKLQTPQVFTKKMEGPEPGASSSCTVLRSNSMQESLPQSKWQLSVSSGVTLLLYTCKVITCENRWKHVDIVFPVFFNYR